MSAPAGLKFDFIDLFAGIGGLRLAFESIGGRCAFTSEWDRFARQTYALNHGEWVDDIAGDINAVEMDSIPKHQVLLAGFPCQPFSLAGVSKKNSMGRAHGFADEAQGTLFFRVAEILRDKRPEAFLLENVRNLVAHDRGNTFRVIRRTLEEELGYHISWKVIDAKRWVPQHRERIFIVGFREDVGFEWPDEASWPQQGAVRLCEILEPARRVDPKYVLSDKLWGYLQGYRAKHEAAGNGFGFSLVGPRDTTRTLSARYHKDGFEILVSRGAGRNPRKLTPREAARLMGYPDTFQFPCSDTQTYHQLGNSVVVPAVEAVAQAMAPYLAQALGARAKRGKRAG